MNIRDFLFAISFIISLMGLAFLLCIPSAIYYHEPLETFYIPALIVWIVGFILYVFSGKRPATFKNNSERVVLITISWVVVILAGMLPYLFSKTIPSLVDVFFETVSGMTTTGSSILINIENLPKSILFWRSLTHWIGGLATIIGLFTILPSLNIEGNEPFLIKENSVHKFGFIVGKIVKIYFALTFIQVLLLLMGGMNLFESFCHSFGTVSTGSFSPKNDSITGYSSYLQYIMALFMFLSGFSYVIYYQVITGKFKKQITMEESKTYSIIVFAVSLMITGLFYFSAENSFFNALRVSIFQVASFVSSSGYYTTNYLNWASQLLPLVYLLIFIGGSSGSPSGGIKISRFLILLKNIKQQLKIPDLSSGNVPVKYNSQVLDENTNLSILTYITVFGFLFVLGTLSLSFFGLELERAVFLAISSLSTFGQPIGLANFPDIGKIIVSFLMIVGKLEIYPLLLLIVPLFYKTSDPLMVKISE